MRFSFLICKLLTFPNATTIFSSSFSETSTKLFPCIECGKLLSSKRALNDHKRKKHNCQENVSARFLKFAQGEVFFSKSCNLLHHLSNQHEAGCGYLCFFCPTHFEVLKSLKNHQEQYHNEISSSTVNVDFTDLLAFTTETMISEYRTHQLKFDDSGALEPFNQLIFVREKVFFECAIGRNVEFEIWVEHRWQAGKA